MSDVTTGTAFNPQFFMNPPWWLGRVEKKETWDDNIEGETFTNVAGIEGWGHRYKVRIFNWHTGDLDKLPPNDMAFCQVVMPVTAGSGHGGASITPSIESGSVVFGFFMDGMAGQEGYIMGVLGNSNNNVPRERGKPAPNQPGSPQPPPPGSPPGTPPTPPSLPPAPPTGPGSLANLPVPSNVDQLTTAQLVKLLDPSKTPSSAVFKAASEARQKARAANLLPNEVERLVLVATVKASRQPGSDAGSSANCNQGYQQFNDTYTDGDLMREARVPDDRIVGITPLSITEAQHIITKAKIDQEKDSKKRIPLLDVCKSGNSQTKGIQRILKNLLNAVEELKKQFNQVSAFATEVVEFSALIQEQVFGAIEEISRFTKDIVNGIRGYITTEFQRQIKKIAPFLFPSEIPKLTEQVENGLSLINCLFNKLIGGLKNLLANLLSNLLDQLISAPLCAAENLLGNILDSILGPIASTLESALAPINALVGGLGGLVGAGLGALGLDGNMFSALEFIPGILQFFSCDDPKECVKYNEISQDRSALPGGDAVSTPSNPKTNSPTGTGENGSQASSVKSVVGEGEEIVNAINENNKPIRESLSTPQGQRQQLTVQ
jgi:hypothetical protein